jgi:hypothetical protein
VLCVQEVGVSQSLSASEFAQRFPNLWERSTFRLELFDFYIAENERKPFADFQAGSPADLSWRRPWQRLVTRAVEAGRRMQRVHVVTEPLVPYIEFELTCAYPTSAAAGEDIRILTRTQAVDLDLPTYDFWLFDDHVVARLNYDGGGNFLAVDFIDGPGVAAQHRRWRDVALKAAVPLATFLETAGLEGQVAADAT